jgi:hypothetical protein
MNYGEQFFLFLLCSFLVARITRYIWMDAQIKELRAAVKAKLQLGHIPDDIIGKPNMEEWINEYKEKHPVRSYWRRKGLELISCGWCISIYVAGPLNLALHLLDVPMRLPAVWWLALSMSAVMMLEYTDGEKPVILKQEKKP